MNFLTELFSDTFIYSFGWTLLHSLWHGAIVSFLTVFLLFFLRNQTSSVRYQITVFSMVVIVLLSMWTFASFYNYYDSLFSTNGAGLETVSKTSLQNNFGIVWINLLPEQILESVSYFTVHLPLIFSAWFISVLFLSLKYMGGFAYSQRLKHNKTKPVNKYWQYKLAEFSNKLDLKQKVILLESALVKVPIVIGYLKPVILIPIGLLTGIPNEQIDAILIHELAHIRRKDYLVKLLQTIVEVLFFFNPFVWWISSIINKEREHSCDDLAISITKDNISFVRALAGLCELEVKKTGFALAFGNSNNQIIKRMERIMKRNENKNSFSQFTIALVILLASLFALGAASFKTSETKAKTESVQDSTKVKKAKMHKDIKAPASKEHNADLMKIKKSMKKIKAAYESETDPDTKKKYKQKLMDLEKKAKWIQKESSTEKKMGKKVIKKDDNLRMIDELKKKLSVTKDEKTKQKIKKKIQYLKQEVQKTPPPPPPPKS